MKIGIYGGTYNPIHRGHTMLAQSLLRQHLVDEVWLLVSPQNPLKANLQDAPSVVSPTYDQRLEMARIATKNIRGIAVSDFERNLPIPSYTITTLNELSRCYPQHEFCLIIGADNWQRFNRWYHSEDIRKNYQILIYRRPGYDIEESKLTVSNQKGITLVNGRLHDVSSTEIREAVSSSDIDNLSGKINKKVLRYIISKGFYITSK